jgi:hypothetical protein
MLFTLELFDAMTLLSNPNLARRPTVKSPSYTIAAAMTVYIARNRIVR